MALFKKTVAEKKEKKVKPIKKKKVEKVEENVVPAKANKVEEAIKELEK